MMKRVIVMAWVLLIILLNVSLSYRHSESSYGKEKTGSLAETMEKGTGQSETYGRIRNHGDHGYVEYDFSDEESFQEVQYLPGKEGGGAQVGSTGAGMRRILEFRSGNGNRGL